MNFLIVLLNLWFYFPQMLPVQLAHLGLGEKTSLVSRFVECFKTMWSSNGDLVSRTYTGTGAMEGGARVRRLGSR